LLSILILSGFVPLTDGNVSLRTASFALKDRWLLWSRMRLYTDRLELTGWYFWGRYHRSIPLVHVEEVEVTRHHLVLHLADESSLQVAVDAPGQWASAIATHRDVRESST